MNPASELAPIEQSILEVALTASRSSALVPFVKLDGLVQVHGAFDASASQARHVSAPSQARRLPDFAGPQAFLYLAVVAVAIGYGGVAARTRGLRCSRRTA